MEKTVEVDIKTFYPTLDELRDFKKYVDLIWSHLMPTRQALQKLCHRPSGRLGLQVKKIMEASRGFLHRFARI